MFLFDIPVTPDADEARRAAQLELEKAIYQPSDTYIGRFLTWLGKVFFKLFQVNPATAPEWLPSLFGFGLLIIIIITLLFIRKIRLEHTAKESTRRSVELFTDSADSNMLLKRAGKFLEAGNYREAFQEHFRALIRYADERALITDRPGMTAQEAATAVGNLTAKYCDSVHRQANTFDAVSYGELVITAQQYQLLAALDELLRPQLAKLPPQVEIEATVPGA